MKVLFAKVGGLGDSLSVLPALAALVQEAEVTVLCSPAGAEVFRRIVPPVRIVAVSPAAVSGARGLRHVPALARRVGRMDAALLAFDACTAVHVAAACVAPRRIGFAARIAKGEALLTERLPFQMERSVYGAALLPVARLLGGVPLLARIAPFTVDKAASPYGVIHPGAATALQRWPGFADLGVSLARATGFPWRVVAEQDGLSLTGLARAIGAARGFVGNHSGPLHLAAAMGTPYVAVAGPTAPSWDPPWPAVPGRVLRAGIACQPCGRLGAPARHCPHRAAGGVPRCLARLTAQDVTDAVAEVLGA